MDEFKKNDNAEDIIEAAESVDAEPVADSAEEIAESVEGAAVPDADADGYIVAKKSSIKKELLDWVFSIVVALVIALVIRRYFFTLVKVDGPSMQPTLYHNDMLYVNRFMYTPKVGDIIIFRPPHSPSTPYVKRVIATEGQTVVIDSHEKKVYVDGVEIEEDYIEERLISAGTVKYPYKVPEDSVFVLGDNRNNSRDSRDATVGAIPRDSIIGKVMFRILPVSDFGTVYED